MVQTTITIPQSVTITSARILAGRIKVDYALDGPNVNTGYYFKSDANTTQANVGNVLTYHAATTYSPNTNANYIGTIIPYNTYGTGVPESTGSLRKLPNPVIIDPTDSNSYRTNAWRNVDTPYQGSDSVGRNSGLYIYGTKIKDTLHSSVIGYTLNISEIELGYVRHSDGNPSAVPLHMRLHDRTAASGVPTISTTDVPVTGVAISNARWVAISEGGSPVLTSWSSELISGATWKGIAFQDTNTALQSGIGNVSLHFQRLGYAGYLFSGIVAGRLRFYHDG